MSEDRRCLVVDRQPVVRLGIRKLLAPKFEVEEAENWTAARDLLTEMGAFDVAILDLERPIPGEPGGAKLIRALRRERPGIGIVAHGRRPERLAANEALKAGASAFVAKSSPAATLFSAVEAAADRDRYVDPAARSKRGQAAATLTKRQREILQLLANGYSTSGAAEHLGLGAETIRSHTKGALARLKARDRTHAVAISLRAGLID